jgi:two-component system chemotaxis response regulator CheV
MSVKTNILLESGTNELEIVEFIIGFNDRAGRPKKQSYGVNVAKVREIIRMPDLTYMPSLPDMVCGVFNLRGHVIPAVDLGKFLYGIEEDFDKKKMLIAEFNKVQVGFIVEDVQRIHRISWKQIMSPDTMEEFNPEKSTVVGLINFEDRHILMLDVEKIVADIDPASAMDASNQEKFFDHKPIAVTAEDSSLIRKLITERLKKAGFEIISFRDGESAWNKMREISQSVANGANLEDLVNVVITDIEMPGMDGYTLTKHIKNDDKLKKLPVVIFSSIVSDDILHKGQSVGADAQMTKPQIGELLDVVRTLIERNMATV